MDIAIEQENTLISRRPIAARSSTWAQNLAKYLGSRGIKANQISVAGLIFATTGALLLISTLFVSSPYKILFWLLAAVTIALRLLCNMLDGLVAIEGNCQSKVGILFNEFPDRVEDSILFIALGLSSAVQPLGTNLGWLVALLSLGTAYIRAFGASLGQGQDFSGPMAKPHRMYALIFTLVLVSLEEILYKSNYSPIIALFTIGAGATVTCFKRTQHIVQKLRG